MSQLNIRTNRHPEMPLIIRKRPTGPSYYPMEVVRVLDNQRVKGDQQIPAQLAVMEFTK